MQRQIVNLVGDSFNEKNKRIETATYSSTKELVTDYIENYSKQVRRAEQKVEPDLHLGWVITKLSLYSQKKDEIQIPNPKSRFLIAGKYCKQ